MTFANPKTEKAIMPLTDKLNKWFSKTDMARQPKNENPKKKEAQTEPKASPKKPKAQTKDQTKSKAPVKEPL